MSVDAARHLVLARRPDLAERELRRWLALHPDNPEGHALLGWSLALQKRPGAVEAAEEAVRLAPEWAYTHAVLGEVRVEIGHSRHAELPLRRALALEPYEPQHHCMLALALTNQRGRFRHIEALRLTEAGIALDPGHAGCARIRALALLNLCRFKEAREAAELAQRLAPENAYGHAIAGWAHLCHRGSGKKSRELLREALRADPENQLALRGLRLASSLSRLGAAIVMEAERSPAWLRAAAGLLVVSVASALVWGHEGEAAGALIGSLVFLLMLEAWTVPVRFTAEGRARMDEMRLPGVMSEAAAIMTRVLMMGMIAMAVACALLASVLEPVTDSGAPLVWHLPWNHPRLPPSVTPLLPRTPG